MRVARTLDRILPLLVSALAAASLFGCKALDPVKTTDLCSGDVLSANCPGCEHAPYLPNCPQCQANVDDPNCSQSNFATDSGAMATSGDGQPAMTAGMSAVAGHSAGYSAANGGAGGANAQAGAGGTSMPMTGGAGGTPLDPSRCERDDQCKPPTPGCLFSQQRCVECTTNQHCDGKACDTNAHRCVECTADGDCKSGTLCDTSLQRCVECRQNTDCKDPLLNICSSALKCVDCDVDRTGCTDPTLPACVGQQCVACDLDGDCTQSDLGKCDRSTHTCVACLTGNSDCRTADRPICQVETQTCVQCLAPTDCTTSHCVAETCVECESDSDCPMIDKADCSNNSCGACTNNTQCAHFPSAPACNSGTGTCVACVDDSTCGEYSCLRSSHTCSTIKRASVGPCGECDADSECTTNLKCLALPGATSISGKNYCLYSRSAVGACASAPSSPTRPYSRSISATSVDGVPGPFCAPPVTCEALIDATTPLGGATCGNGKICGIGMNDGVCNNTSRCTYGCGTDADCPTSGFTACLSHTCALPVN